MRRAGDLTVGALYGLIARASYGVVPPGEPPRADPMWQRLLALLGDYGVTPERVRWGALVTRDLGLH